MAEAKETVKTFADYIMNVISGKMSHANLQIC